MDSNYMAWKGMKVGDAVWACKANMRGYNPDTMRPTKGILSSGERCFCPHGLNPSPVAGEVKEFVPVNESGEADWDKALPIKDLLFDNTEDGCKSLYISQLNSVWKNLMHAVSILVEEIIKFKVSG